MVSTRRSGVPRNLGVLLQTSGLQENCPTTPREARKKTNKTPKNPPQTLRANGKFPKDSAASQLSGSVEGTRELLGESCFSRSPARPVPRSRAGRLAQVLASAPLHATPLQLPTEGGACSKVSWIWESIKNYKAS